MPTAYWGGVSAAGNKPTAFTQSGWSWGTGMASGLRACSDGVGRGRVLVTAHYLGGRSGARTVNSSILGQAGSGAAVASASSPSILVGIGYPTPPIFGNGQGATLQVSSSGSFWFNRNSGGPGTIVDTLGTSYAGSPAGYYSYSQAPSEPQTVTVTPSPDGLSALVAYAAPADNGGETVSGYQIQRADDAAFTVNVATVAASGTSQTITGLTPGNSYYWRVTAANPLTSAAGVLGGTWSSTVLATQPSSGIGTIEAPSGFVQANGLIYTSSGWQQVDGVEYTSTGWQPIG